MWNKQYSYFCLFFSKVCVNLFVQWMNNLPGILTSTDIRLFTKYQQALTMRCARIKLAFFATIYDCNFWQGGETPTYLQNGTKRGLPYSRTHLAPNKSSSCRNNPFVALYLHQTAVFTSHIATFWHNTLTLATFREVTFKRQSHERVVCKFLLYRPNHE